MEEVKHLVENTTGPNDPNIATTDENLSVNAIFQQTLLPSLGRQIFPVVKMHGPTAAIFNIKKKAATNDLELLRSEVQAFGSTSIKSAITKEAIQDLVSQFGKDGKQMVGQLLRGLANEQENTATISFLDTNAVAGTTLTLSDSLNAQTNLFEVTQKVSELVLKMNSLNLRTYEASVVLPYTVAASVMALGKYAGGEDTESRGLFITQIGSVKYFMNPVATSTTAYVVLNDSENMSKSSAVFGKYAENVVETTDPDTGENVYFIFNRFALGLSPLHVAGNEMMYKFTIA